MKSRKQIRRELANYYNLENMPKESVDALVAEELKKVRKYPKSGVWDEKRRGRQRLNLRIPARVARVCKLKQGVRVEWRFYKTGVNKFHATIQQVD